MFEIQILDAQNISSVENQKGINAVQRYFIEN